MWFDIHCRQLDWHGRDAAAVYAHDVTEQQRRQRSLELSWQQLEAILGNIPGGVAIFSDRDGSIRLDYTNDGFYAVHHGSRAFWDRRSADPVDWLRASDRAAFEDEFRAVRSGEKKEGSATYRVDGEDGAPHWINNQFRRAYSKNGVQYYYSSFVCLDQQRAAEAARGEARRMYEAAVEDAKLVVWQYDHDPAPRASSWPTTSSPSTTTASSDCPRRVENAPQALVPYIAEDSDGGLPRQLYRAVAAGRAPKASCEVWYRLRPGPRAALRAHLSYTTLFDAAGKPVKRLRHRPEHHRPKAARRRTTSACEPPALRTRSPAPWAQLSAQPLRQNRCIKRPQHSTPTWPPPAGARHRRRTFLRAVRLTAFSAKGLRREVRER
jgi:hypothetical protein